MSKCGGCGPGFATPRWDRGKGLNFCIFCHPKVRMRQNYWILIQNMQLLPAFGPRFDGMVVFKSNHCNIRDAFISGRQEKLVYVPCIIGKVLFALLDHQVSSSPSSFLPTYHDSSGQDPSRLFGHSWHWPKQSDLFTGDDADCQTSSTSYIMIKYLKEKTLMVNLIETCSHTGDLTAGPPLHWRRGL